MTGVELILNMLVKKRPDIAQQIAQANNPRAVLDKLLANNAQWIRLAQKIAKE